MPSNRRHSLEDFFSLAGLTRISHNKAHLRETSVTDSRKRLDAHFRHLSFQPIFCTILMGILSVVEANV